MLRPALAVRAWTVAATQGRDTGRMDQFAAAAFRFGGHEATPDSAGHSRYRAQHVLGTGPHVDYALAAVVFVLVTRGR